jgi:GrpB-like predicted nucleotidyltransferase (UPF0157 family)
LWPAFADAVERVGSTAVPGLAAKPVIDVDLRDHLRRNPDAVHRYAAEKRRLASHLATDRDAYVDGKAWLVRELLAEARRA